MAEEKQAGALDDIWRGTQDTVSSLGTSIGEALPEDPIMRGALLGGLGGTAIGLGKTHFGEREPWEPEKTLGDYARSAALWGGLGTGVGGGVGLAAGLEVGPTAEELAAARTAKVGTPGSAAKGALLTGAPLLGGIGLARWLKGGRIARALPRGSTRRYGATGLGLTAAYTGAADMINRYGDTLFMDRGKAQTESWKRAREFAATDPDIWEQLSNWPTALMLHLGNAVAPERLQEGATGHEPTIFHKRVN
jgi:hypothetical protein